MKSYLTILLTVYALGINAQSIQQKLFGGKNRIEVGNTYANFFKNDRFNKNKNVRVQAYFGYTRIIKKTHLISLNFRLYEAYFKNNYSIGEVESSFFDVVGIQYGRKFNYKQIEIIPFAGINYRYFGLESAIFGYRDPVNKFEPLFADLKYNSVGGSVGLDANYYIFKNLGVGVKYYYANFPFENGKLIAGGDASRGDQPSQSIIENYKPITEMFNLHLKLIGRF